MAADWIDKAAAALPSTSWAPMYQNYFQLLVERLDGMSYLTAAITPPEDPGTDGNAAGELPKIVDDVPFDVAEFDWALWSSESGPFEECDWDIDFQA